MTRFFTQANKDGVHQANVLSWVLDKLSGLWYLATRPATPSTIVGGKKAIAASGTQETLVASSKPCCWVDVCADTDKGIIMVVGDSSVDATTNNKNGIILIPGNPPVRIYIDDVQKLYADAASNGGVVCFTYYNY